MKLFEHCNRAVLQMTNSAATLVLEYSAAGLPCSILDSSGIAAQNAIGWRANGAAKDQPVVLFPPADLSKLGSLLNADMRKQYLAQERVEIRPARLTDTATYITDWVHRIEHEGQVALLREKIKEFYFLPAGTPEFSGQIPELNRRQEIEGSMTRGIDKVHNSNRTMIFRLARNPIRLFPPLRLTTFDAENIIIR